MAQSMAETNSLAIPSTHASASAPSRTITSSDLLALRELGGVLGKGLSVSPDGEYLAFELHQADVDMNNYRVAWFVANTKPGSIPVNVGDGGDAILFRSQSREGWINGAWISEYPLWSPDSTGIAYRKKVNGETQIWWSSKDGIERKQLTNNVADVEAFLWSSDGSKLFFTTDADRSDLEVLGNSRSRAGHVFDYGNKIWSAMDGKPYYLPYELTGGQARIWVYDLQQGAERLANDAEVAEYEQLKPTDDQLPNAPLAREIARTIDRSGVAWLQPTFTDKQGWRPPMTLYASLSPDGSNPIRCDAPECSGFHSSTEPMRDIAVYWGRLEDDVLFARYDGFASSKRTLFAWTVGEDHVREILSTDEWITDCHIEQDRALCFRESPTYPRSIIAINLVDGSIDTIVDPNPEFRELVIGDVEPFEWMNTLGHESFGYLVKPQNYVAGRRYPLVLVGYSSRFALRGGVGDEYPVHALAANGFMVLVYDRPRNWSAYETLDPSDSLGFARSQWGPDLFGYRMPLSSFETAVHILSEQGLIDSSRVGVTGLSNGQTHVNYAIIHSDLFSAAITSSSSLGPSTYFTTGLWDEKTQKMRNELGTGRYGGPSDFHWQHIALSLNAERVNTPLLVNSADSEHLPALEEVTALIEHNKPVELVVYPNEYHIKWQPAHRASVYERNIDWMKFWLQGVEDPDATKAPQYIRWHKQRERHIENTESAGKN